MIYFISGPISGTEGYLDHFKRAEELIKYKGHEAINPAEIGELLPKSFEHEDYMDICMAELKKCTGIYMLSGWKDSKGAVEEFEYALNLGYVIAFEDGKGDIH